MCEAITREYVEAEVERLWRSWTLAAEWPLVGFMEGELRAQFTDNPQQKWALRKLHCIVSVQPAAPWPPG